MKIGMVVNSSLNPQSANGVNVFVKSVSDALGNNCEDIKIIAFSKKTTLVKTYDMVNFTLFRVPKNNNNILNILNTCDTILFNGVFISNYYFLFRKLLKQRKPYYIFSHGALREEAMKRKPLKKNIAFFVFKHFLKNAQGIICFSKEEKLFLEKNNFKNYYLISQITPIKPVKKANKILERPIKLIYLGRMDVYGKGLDVLIKSISSIKEDIILTIVGPTNKKDKRQLNKLSKNIPNKLLNINPPVYGDEKYKFLRNFDYFILPSRSEGYPIVLLEAMSLGLPVLITKETGASEEISENNCGVILDELSTRSIVDGISYLCNLTNYEYNKFRNNAIECAKKHKPEIVTEKIMKIIHCKDDNRL